MFRLRRNNQSWLIVVIFIVVILCGAVCFADFVSLPTSTVFHDPNCVSIAGKVNLVSGTWDYFISINKTPCKKCNPGRN